MSTAPVAKVLHEANEPVVRSDARRQTETGCSLDTSSAHPQRPAHHTPPRVSAARALDEMAARERLVESGRAFRERLTYLETIPSSTASSCYDGSSRTMG
jgi:hypothetical protein